MPADRLVKLPEGISFDIAAAMMLKGMTAEYLLCRTFPVKKGDTILFHAAAGGVGLIAGQWAKSLGATVIGTAGSPEKIELARAHGYDHVINYRTEDFVARVRELTDGKGCDVVYDSVGKDAFPGSLDCLRPRGMWVLFGQSSGACSAGRSRHPCAEGLAVCHPADVVHLCRFARGPRTVFGAALRCRRERDRAHRNQPDLSACRGEPGACRPGSAQNHWNDVA